MVHIRYVKQEDRAFWFQLDRHLSPAEFDKKVRDQMGYVLLEDGNPVALLRYHLFWDNTPFCSMLFVAPDAQRRGYGRALMEHWEREMGALGYKIVLVSTQADEDAQHFYRKLGYRDTGGLVLNCHECSQAMELFFVKAL